MADWSMEPAAVWMPSELANWTMQPVVCAPGLPVEYASTEIFGSCYQTSVPICGGQQCEYEVDTQYNLNDETAKREFVVDIPNMETINSPNPILLFSKVAKECNDEVDITAKKMHRYPASIRALCLNERYTAPTVVSIGPYYHGRNHQLKRAEKMKHVAAFQCATDSRSSIQKLYDAVVSVAHGVRSLYEKDVVGGIGDDDFLPMMFYDACFLVQYMGRMSDYENPVKMEESLSSFFETNDNEIFHDIMLLENQIPWSVVETVMRFRPVHVEKFILSLIGCLQDLKRPEEKPFVMDDNYQPPHFLGLLRFYIVGKSKAQQDTLSNSGNQISLSVSANELAETGIKLKANKSIELIHMGVMTKWAVFGELFLAPLSLDDARASYLISMAALELCTTSNFQATGVKDEDSAVCSYLLVLAMLVTREEDVQKLRTHHVLQGGGLTNRQVLDLFSSLHNGLRLGTCFIRTMQQIGRYRHNRQTRCWLYGLYYRNKKALAIVVPILLTLVGIIMSVLLKRST